MRTEEKMDVSIIMSALNEEKNIVASINNTLKAFDDLSINGEIIVVNDGSRDKTQYLVNELVERDSRVRLINHPVNLGVGASFWDGVKLARGRAITTVPGDNENDAKEILQYFGLLKYVDIVVPFVINKKARSFFRNALSFIYLRILNLSFGVNFNYTNGAVFYRRLILSQVGYKSRGFFFQAEILIKLAKSGYLFAEVPYKLRLRGKVVSKAVTLRSLFEVSASYLKLFKDVYFEKKKLNIVQGSLTAERMQNE